MVARLTGNADFIFTDNELDNLATASADFNVKLSLARTGDIMSIRVKNEALHVLLAALSTISIQIHLQAKGDMAKLAGTGGVLAQKPVYHSMVYYNTTTARSLTCVVFSVL
ncbi:hypothetical protein F5148DRAFT_1289067 [Russula earlei]|uniref:Uncharacterized protein n=1 Tax=Russula earlei TaxID=71964 RepID=A0ACC0TZF2_9AGAM|nr:hypothetical protein F5148DRAFT_1289067 [Russula earlei]